MNIVIAILQQLSYVSGFVLKLLFESRSDLLKRRLTRLDLGHLLSHALVLLFRLLLNRNHDFRNGLNHFELEIVNSIP